MQILTQKITVMKKILIVILVILTSFLESISQPPQGFNYQAAIRKSETEMYANENITVKVSIIPGSPTNNPVYIEQQNAKTNALGVVSIAVGFGTPITGTFSAIDWSGGKMYIKLEVNFGQGFKDIGTTQILSVPYALFSGNDINNIQGTEGQTLVHTGNKWQANSQIIAKENVTIKAAQGRNPNDAIFAVKNTAGDTVFAVYETGVRIFIEEESGKASRGGFSIGGLSTGKDSHNTEYFKVTPDSSFIQFKTDNNKASRGGFSIGGLSTGKETTTNYLTVTPELTNVYFDSKGKASRGGFSIGGLSTGKSDPTEYFHISGDSIRMYIDTDYSKASRGGFSIGGLSTGKSAHQTYFSVEPHHTQFRFDTDLLSKASRGGFSIGGLSTGKNDYTKDYFTVQPDNIVIAMNETNAKEGSKGIFKIATYENNSLSEVMTVDRDSTILSNLVYVKGNLGVTGDINVGGSIYSTVEVDGVVYPTILIGTQTWMIENLRSTKWGNTDESLPSGSYFPYENDANNTPIYGYLYTKEALSNGNRLLCPEGWRLPTSNEWYDLIENVKSLFPNDNKSMLSSHFTWGQTGAGTNNSEFGAVPGGRKSQNSFIEINSKGYYWVNNPNAEQALFFPESNIDISTVSTTETNTGNGYSVRCLK